MHRIPDLVRRDEGNAMVEFVFLGIILLVPLVYLVLAALGGFLAGLFGGHTNLRTAIG